MTCRWCGSYWACGDEPPDLCDPGGAPGPELMAHVPEYQTVGEVELQEGTTYYLKCQPGHPCDALVEENPDVSPPWISVGAVNVPQDVPAGLYYIKCRTGLGQACQVAIGTDPL